MYAISADTAFKEKALYLSSEFWNCYQDALERDPFFTAHSHYDIEKLLKAQCDLYVYCNLSSAKEHALLLVDFADKNLTSDNLFGNNFTEWYTLPESFLDAWKIFGIEKAKELAKRFEYREFWDIFYQDADPFSKRPQAGFYVSQFIPSTLHWKPADYDVTITQTTDFPRESSSQITLNLTGPCTFNIHFRMPGWLAGSMTVSLNGRPLETSVNPSGWLTVRAMWHDKDTLTIALPQNVWMHSFDPVKKGPNAFLHGPVVLAADYSGIQTPNDHMNIRSLIPKMRPVEGKPMHYTVDGIDTISFRPFYEWKENERYFLYHDTTAHAGKR